MSRWGARNGLHYAEAAMRSELVDVSVILIHETDAAWKVRETDTDIWIPKSVGQLDPNPDGKSYTLTLPRSWFEDKGFVGDL